MENKEALKALAIVSESADAVEDRINDFLKVKGHMGLFKFKAHLSNGIMTASIVISRIFFTSDQLFRME